MISNAAQYIKSKAKHEPEVGLILGSGLGVLADEIGDAVRIKYEDIPDFPVSTVEGHAGQLVIGTLIVTNAAGGVNESFRPGDLMIISDHINYMGTNPLIGPNDSALGVRFPDMSQAYDKELRRMAKQTAEELNIPVQEGVYTAVSGPSYETPAEVRFLRTIGSDAVGMSTVPEVIVARHSGLRVLGISCISNAAAGILDQPLSHDEVMEVTEKVKSDFWRLIKAAVAKIGEIA